MKRDRAESGPLGPPARTEQGRRGTRPPEEESAAAGVLAYRLCPACGRAVLLSSPERYCINDGVWLLEGCPLCGAAIGSPYARYCPRCGLALRTFL